PSLGIGCRCHAQRGGRALIDPAGGAVAGIIGGGGHAIALLQPGLEALEPTGVSILAGAHTPRTREQPLPSPPAHTAVRAEFGECDNPLLVAAAIAFHAVHSRLDIAAGAFDCGDAVVAFCLGRGRHGGSALGCCLEHDTRPFRYYAFGPPI